MSVTAWLTLWQFGVALHGPVHSHADSGTAFALLFVCAWTVMTVAMMLPTSVPLIATFDTIAGRRRDRGLLVTLVIVGYLVTWTLVGLLFYAIAIPIQRLAHVNPWVHTHAGAWSAVLLLVAGIYQFTPLKYRCLDKCRSPLSFVLEHWQGQHDRRNAFWLGSDAAHVRGRRRKSWLDAAARRSDGDRKKRLLGPRPECAVGALARDGWPHGAGTRLTTSAVLSSCTTTSSHSLSFGSDVILMD
jgi:hypothetical protein